MDMPIEIPRNSVEGFPFLYTLLKKVWAVLSLWFCFLFLIASDVENLCLLYIIYILPVLCGNQAHKQEHSYHIICDKPERLWKKMLRSQTFVPGTALLNQSSEKACLIFFPAK
jgi:hypothetical protein